MELPNYFFADLPGEVTLSPQIVTDACLALRSNRRRFLAERSTASLIDAITAVAQDWLEPSNPYRRHALEHAALTGFSPATLEHGLDAFFSGLTAEGLWQLVVQDLGHLHRLDRMTATEGGPDADRLALARGPELLVHITGGRLPNPVLTHLVHGLLVRAAQFVKCASGTSFLPRLFAHSLHEVEPKLSACLEIAEWPGGTRALEQALFAQADCITATGSDETIAAIREQIPAGVRFLGYGHRLSFGYLADEVLVRYTLPKVVERAAEDVVAWDQLGCLSPHVFYVETGNPESPVRFAELLAEELAEREMRQPRGPLPTAEAATIASRRAFYEVRAAHSVDTRLWCSPGSTAWTVVYENDPTLHPSCLNRFVYVKAVAGLDEALAGVEGLRGKISTVGLAATGRKEQALALRLAHWGVARICPLGQMQRPAPTWRHDGRPSLGDLVTWTDWEPPSRW